MPDSVEIPAPVSATMRADSSIQRHTLSMLSHISVAQDVLGPAIQVVIRQTLVHEPGTLIENAGAAGEIHRVDANLLVIAGVVPLVEFVTPSKLGPDRVPHDLEEFDPFERRGTRAAIVAVDEGAQIGIHEILAAGWHHQRSATQNVL